MFNITVRQQEILHELENILAKSKNMQMTMKIAAQIMEQSVKKNFTSQGRYESADSLFGGSKKWKPLSQKTIMARTKRYKGNYTKKGRISKRGQRFISSAQILIDRAILKNSIKGSNTKYEAIVSSNVIYAATQHFGRDNIPERPFMHIQETDVDTIQNIIASKLIN
jgi:phage gpG-like protein